jgi:hypothetical protein
MYTHLYIRKPDPTPYGQYNGDVDFVLSGDEYVELKKLLLDGEEIKVAQIYDRVGWDTIQLIWPGINSVGYISTKEFAEKVRVRF